MTLDTHSALRKSLDDITRLNDNPLQALSCCLAC